MTRCVVCGEKITLGRKFCEKGTCRWYSHFLYHVEVVKELKEKKEVIL